MVYVWAAQNGRVDRVFPVFFATWVVLGVASYLFFWRGRDAAAKRRAYPAFTIGVAALFIFFNLLMGIPATFLVVLVPALSVITWLNLRHVQFCDQCGRTVSNQGWAGRSTYCPYCGQAL